MSNYSDQMAMLISAGRIVPDEVLEGARIEREELANPKPNYLLAVQTFAAVLGSVSRNEMQDMHDYQKAISTDLAVNSEKRRIAKVLAAVLKKELEQY